VTWILEFLRAYAVEIGTVASILSIATILVTPWQKLVAWWQTKAARDGTAHVLAMELLPIVTGIKEDLERALKRGWDTDRWNVHAWQETRIGGTDVLERFLARLPILDVDTRRPILNMWSAMRDYHRLQSADMRQLTQTAVAGELAQRRGWLEAACRDAAEAVKRLAEVAKV
jgi:hypothetical protein